MFKHLLLKFRDFGVGLGCGFLGFSVLFCLWFFGVIFFLLLFCFLVFTVLAF